MSGNKVLWGQVLIVGLVVLTAVWTATEWTAWKLAFQPELGRPFGSLFALPLYAPPVFFWWWFEFNAYAPKIFAEGAYIAAGGSLTSVVVAIAMSIWRGPGRAPGHHLRLGPLGERQGDQSLGPAWGLWRGAGSDRATVPAPRRTGARPLLLRPPGPARACGLVIPSLLTWGGSCIVHDIKGENFQLTAGFRGLFSRVLKFDPTDSRSAAYNPLLEVRKGPTEVRDVQNIADILVDPEGALEKRSHWEKNQP